MESGRRTDHEILVNNLSANTRYYYAVGHNNVILAGGDNSYRFDTSPQPGQSDPTRIWIIGDAGTANANAVAVYHAYLNYGGAENTDLWLVPGVMGDCTPGWK